MKEHVKNYVTHDLELDVMLHALKWWRHYLIGGRDELIIDNINLNYLFDHPKLNSRQATWMEFLREFDFAIKLIIGKENNAINALRRKIHVVVVII